MSKKTIMIIAGIAVVILVVVLMKKNNGIALGGTSYLPYPVIPIS